MSAWLFVPGLVSLFVIGGLLKHEKTLWSFTLLLLLIVGHPTYAAESGRTLVNAFGISAPSSTTLLLGYENPAGFSQLGGIKLQLLAGDTNNAVNTRYYHGGIYAGNNVFGVGAMGRKYTSDAGNQDTTDLLWGLGGGIDRIAIGVKGTTTGGDNSTTTSQFGFMFGTHSALTVGAIFQSDSQSSYDFGAGLGYDLTPGANFALDVLHYRVSGELSYAAGVRLASAALELSVGYKVMDKNNTGEEHVMAGLAFNMSQMFSVQYLYNHLLKHMLGVTVRF